MTEFLDSLLQSPLVKLLGLLCGMVSFAAYWRSRHRKRVTYRARQTGTQYSFDEKTHKNRAFAIVELRLKYSGNTFVDKDDFDGPVVFIFDKGDIKDVIREREAFCPDSLIYSYSENKLKLEPFLLNDKDEVSLTVLVENYCNVSAVIHIAGVVVTRVSRPRDAVRTFLENIIKILY
ncbi:MAG: hypothetical protein UT86_C0001G0237 [Candidatus Magasanikbacteria bacterium GW2011_GWC2_40_17]|uniref:Uncharacterized protein n=1 Tax=Candidatus Magasanikbacteria bacterium GW2011_GWA2_42_32 TaxID=1619039 RepID=A0A0G1A9A6_9BACT|nr:MAG: hypothetical protein UT86_C0001G0237 [Candidatus Magasanikbacteria bacterium GW2011_GWC2_40_17]KKS57597.1 MAG: hypothetical protein UV20_C0001G0237 [Candidatus Magasanikbacteria bacterium GW2011_GWA2_42_32]